MPRTSVILAPLAAAALFATGCQHAPQPTPAAPSPAADPLALQQPIFQQNLAQPPASQPIGGDVTPSSGRHILTAAGQINGGNGVIYLIDEDRDLLSAMTYVPQSKRIIHMDPIDLNRVFGAGGATAAPTAERFAITGDGRTARGQKYVAIVCPLAQGDEALYLVNRAGIVAVFTFDATTQRLDSRAVNSLSDVLK